MNHPYELTERQDVYEVLPSTFRSILDVGCSRGGFCRLVKRHNPGATVWGIEPNHDAATEARTHADEVIIGHFPEDLPSGAPLFDVIVFADVLEHLIDPLGVLWASLPRLAEGGVIVASIPNVRHWRVLKKVGIEGDFTYSETGILDRTHLRFFTRSTMHQLFDDAGLRVTTCEPADLSMHPAFRLLRRALPNLGPELTAAQFLLVGRPRSSVD